MSGPTTAREVIDELQRLFVQVDFELLRDSLEDGVDREQANELLGEFSRFLQERVASDVVIDMSASPTAGLWPDAARTWHGWRGWIEFWRTWTEAWAGQEALRLATEELDAERVIEHVRVRQVGRGSGVEASWEAWQLWVVRDGRIVRLAGFETRDQALAAAEDAAG